MRFCLQVGAAPFDNLLNDVCMNKYIFPYIRSPPPVFFARKGAGGVHKEFAYLGFQFGPQSGSQMGLRGRLGAGLGAAHPL